MEQARCRPADILHETLAESRNWFRMRNFPAMKVRLQPLQLGRSSDVQIRGLNRRRGSACFQVYPLLVIDATSYIGLSMERP